MMAMNTSQQDWYTPEQAAALLGVTVWTLKTWANDGGYKTPDGRIMPIRTFAENVRGRARFVYDRANVDAVQAERQKYVR